MGKTAYLNSEEFHSLLVPGNFVTGGLHNYEFTYSKSPYRWTQILEIQRHWIVISLNGREVNMQINEISKVTENPQLLGFVNASDFAREIHTPLFSFFLVGQIGETQLHVAKHEQSRWRTSVDDETRNLINELPIKDVVNLLRL